MNEIVVAEEQVFEHLEKIQESQDSSMEDVEQINGDLLRIFGEIRPGLRPVP
ncbi:hypothetical protein ACFTAO_09540 [Paenibacillus rhizoplanae]